MRIVGGAHSRTAGIRQAKFDALFGGSQTAILIEDQSARLEMNRILHLLWRRLIRTLRAFSIRLQINMNFAVRNYILCLGIILKVRAVDLVEAVRLPSVDHDVHIVQLGAATVLEFLSLCSMNGKYSAPILRFGNGKTLGAPLDVGRYGWNAGDVPESQDPTQIKGGNDQDGDYRASGKEPSK